MTPKEKAVELVDKFCKLTRWKMGQEDYIKRAKQCAIIAVDEIIKELEYGVGKSATEWWHEVKKEIEAL
jgi:hypothetical protein